MTQQEALQEARRRWGPTGEVGRYWSGRLDYWVDADLNAIGGPCGDGNSWEADSKERAR